MEQEAVERRLVQLLKHRAAIVGAGQYVPPELEREIDELNKDLEFLSAETP